MREEPTTAVVQCYWIRLWVMPAEPIVRELLERAAYRLEKVLLRQHAAPELPAIDQTADESGDGGNAWRRGGGAAQGHAFDSSPNRGASSLPWPTSTCWQLNDLARCLDERPAAGELREELVPAPTNSESGITPDGRLDLGGDRQPAGGRTRCLRPVRLQGLTQVETAEVLYVSVKTVSRRLNRASLLLAEELDDLHTGCRGRPTPCRTLKSVPSEIPSVSICLAESPPGGLLPGLSC